MSELKFMSVKPTTTALEQWQRENGAFANVPEFGISDARAWYSSKGTEYVQCELKAFVTPGQFVRVLQSNPNAKWGRITEVKDGKGKAAKGTGVFDLELFSDSAEQPKFKLDKDGLLVLLD
jgi:hypothetical protein